MKSYKIKEVKIFSDGSLNFSYSNISKSDFFIFNEIDIKNFSLNKKKLSNNIRSESFSNYKNKYLV
jgi:hypothetical protein